MLLERELAERLRDAGLTYKMQWRGSDDAVTWTNWRILRSLHQALPAYEFYQARIIWSDGTIDTSPIGFD